MRRARTCAALTPAIASVFFRLVSPATTETSRRGTPSARATKATSCAFAAPSTGGAASDSFSRSPCTPTTAVFAARGTTCTSTRTPAPWARTMPGSDGDELAVGRDHGLESLARRGAPLLDPRHAQRSAAAPVPDLELHRIREPRPGGRVRRGVAQRLE